MAFALYCDYANAKAVLSPFSTAAGALPALIAGATIDIDLYYLAAGSNVGTGQAPFRIQNFDDATMIVRLRNSNTAHNGGIYAQATAFAQTKPPFTPAVVSTSQDGTMNGAADDDSAFEKQLVTFASEPGSGRFTIAFANMGSTQGWGPEGTSLPISVSATEAEITNAIEIMAWRNSGGTTAGRRPFIVTRPNNTSLFLNWNNKGNKPACTVNIADATPRTRWSGPLALTDSQFNDLFDSTYGPAYLEILLTPSGSAEFVALQELITQGGYTPTPPPPPPDTGGGTPSSGANRYDDGNYSTALADGDVVITPLHFPEATEYRQAFVQDRRYWSRLALDSVCPHDGNAFLFNETEGTASRGYIKRWERQWTTVPANWEDSENIDYTYQQTFAIGGVNQIATTVLNRRARVFHEYYHTSNPAAIANERVPRVLLVNNAYTPLDGFTNLAAGATTVGRDSILRRYKGNIWERVRWQITI